MTSSAAELVAKAIATSPTDSQSAYRLAVSAVHADPEYADAWYVLANANSDMGAYAASVACHRRAVEINPNDAKALTNLGHILYLMGNMAEAKQHTLRAIELEPKQAFAWCNLSLIQSVDGDLLESLNSAQTAYELDKTSPAIEMGLGFAYLFERDWINGLKHHEARFNYSNFLKRYNSLPMPRWQGELINDKTLFIVAEQGMGDVLSLLRFVTMAAERQSPDQVMGTIMLQVHSELMRLVGQMMKPWPNIFVGPLVPVIPKADYWCSLSSLPLALGLTNEEFEAAKSPSVPHGVVGPTTPWKVPGRRLHVGIAWAGSSENGVDKWRSMKIEQFLEFCRVPGVQLYSLQVGEHATDIHLAGASGVVKDMAPYIRDMHDTACVIRDLDLVITVESVLGHLCGVLGADCWVLYSKAGGDWRLGRDERGSLWYPRTTVFKQTGIGDWTPVLERVVAALRDRTMI